MPRHKWLKYGEGSFNTVYRLSSDDSPIVLKLQKNKIDQTDNAERSVRIWNELNGDFPPPASLIRVEKIEIDNPPLLLDERGFVIEDDEIQEGKTVWYEGWTCPWINGEQASDEEIQRGLIDVYNRSQRVVLDAYTPGNFIKTKTKNGEERIACVDIGMALKMELGDEQFFKNREQRNSDISIEAWETYNRGYATRYEEDNNHPHAVKTIKALLYIRTHRPDIFNVDFLKKTSELPESIEILAEAYDYQQSQQTNNSLLTETNPLTKANELLKKERPIEFTQIQSSCIHQLNRYITSRGAIKYDGEFEPSKITSLFRNKTLTQKKVDAAKNLINLIKQANSVEDIEQFISENQESNPQLTNEGKLGMNLKICLLFCEISKSSDDLSKHQAITP